MILHAVINLEGVDMAKFEEYEDAVIAMLPKYGIEMVVRLRAEDGKSEVHVLDTPEMAAMERFRADPDKAKIQHLWDECGATGVVTQMVRLG